jgi:hypothetical protein
MTALLIALLVSSAGSGTLQATSTWPTLAETLREHRVPMPDGVDGAQRITSFEMLDDAGGFVIAYYDVVPDGLLHTLHVRAFDRRSRTWHAAAFDAIGSVLSVQRAGRLLFLEGHSSPSSGPLLVLSAELTERHRMDGWIVHTIADGRVLFVRGMRHFAPTHAEALAVYDPATNVDVTIYPVGSDNDRGAEQEGELWIDRSFGDVVKGGRANTIEFPATVLRMRIESDNQGHEAGPKTRLAVTCDLTPRVPVCRDAPSR